MTTNIREKEIALDHVNSACFTSTILGSILRDFVNEIQILSYTSRLMLKIQKNVMHDSTKLIELKQSSNEVFEGRLLHVFLDNVRLPNGSNSTREWIKHPGASAVLPVFENGDVMMVQQFRYPVQQIFHEVPAGTKGRKWS